jgi:hypothetical protein
VMLRLPEVEGCGGGRIGDAGGGEPEPSSSSLPLPFDMRTDGREAEPKDEPPTKHDETELGLTWDGGRIGRMGGDSEW